MAQVKLETLLTTEGLNEQGVPVTIQQEFSLSEDDGVQYYVAWLADEQNHNLVVKWFDPQDKLVNLLSLSNFSKNVVRDYISFSNKTQTQLFVPDQVGEYTIYLYCNQEVIAITTFRITE
ncbi:hypothetical protein [Halanaerobaculum tunisiense]